MPSNFKAQGTTAGSRPVHELLLNGFHLALSSETFSARRMALPDNMGLKDLRAQHPDWFTHWRNGFLYAVPKTASPGTTIGEPVTLNCSEHLQFIVAVIDGLLPKKFPGYEAFRRHPFAFAGKKDELVISIL